MNAYNFYYLYIVARSTEFSQLKRIRILKPLFSRWSDEESEEILKLEVGSLYLKGLSNSNVFLV